MDTIDHISRLITGANCHIVIVMSEEIMIYQSQTARKLDDYIKVRNTAYEEETRYFT